MELHIGERNKLDKYSGGYTAWQDEKKSSSGQFKLKIWYGWFGRGTNNDGDIIPTVIRYIKKLLMLVFLIFCSNKVPFQILPLVPVVLYSFIYVILFFLVLFPFLSQLCPLNMPIVPPNLLRNNISNLLR